MRASRLSSATPWRRAQSSPNLDLGPAHGNHPEAASETQDLRNIGLDRSERRVRRLIRLLQLAVVLLAAATGLLAWREATRPPAIVPAVWLATPEAAPPAQSSAQAELEQARAELQQLNRERDRLAFELQALQAQLAAAEGRIAALEQMLASARQTAAGQRESLARERQRNQQLWLRLQQAEAQLTRARAALANASGSAPEATVLAAAETEAAADAQPATAISGEPSALREETEASTPMGSVADGVEAYRRGDYQRAFAVWQPLAEAGNAKAQFHLGAMLFEGRLGAPDPVNAYVWLERSVRNGYQPAAALRDRVRARLGPEQLRAAQARLGS